MKLKQLRISENKSQTEFAKQFNLTQGTYSNYENGTTEPPIQTLVEIADYYNVSVDYLIGRDFNNEVGYLSVDDKNFVKMYLSLDDYSKVKVIGYVSGLLASR